jgi:hypothetical protein
MSQFAAGTGEGILTMIMLLPVACGFFHLFAMIPVCIKSEVWLGILYTVLMFGFNLAAFFCELYGNGPLCEGTAGILSGSALSVLITAFYRIIAQLFYGALKSSEKEDGLPIKRKGIDEPTTSDETKPFPVEFKDYSYDYTYSDAEQPQD